VAPATKRARAWPPTSRPTIRESPQTRAPQLLPRLFRHALTRSPSRTSRTTVHVHAATNMCGNGLDGLYPQKSELQGRALVVIAAEQYASWLVVPRSQRMAIRTRPGCVRNRGQERSEASVYPVAYGLSGRD
jgi:hypothetical protein